MNTMKRTTSFVLIAALSVILIGCGSFVNNVKKGEYAAATLADGTMKGYAEYWKTATNNPAAYGRTMDGLNQERDAVMVKSRKVGASLQTLDKLLVVYQTNNAVKPTITGVLTTLTAEAADLSTLTSYLMGPGRAPLNPDGTVPTFAPLPAK